MTEIHPLVGTTWRTVGWIGPTKLIQVFMIVNSAITDKPHTATVVYEDGHQETGWPLNRRGTRLRGCIRARV